MTRPIKVEPLVITDCACSMRTVSRGGIDLSDLVGRGVFAPLRDEAFFRKVRIGDHGQIAWSDDLEICPDSAYPEITGKIAAPAKHA